MQTFLLEINIFQVKANYSLTVLFSFVFYDIISERLKCRKYMYVCVKVIDAPFLLFKMTKKERPQNYVKLYYPNPNYRHSTKGFYL